jgi:hypothetical protein
MTIERVSNERIHINKRMLTTGAALVTVGGLLGFVGMALFGTAMYAAARDWVQHMEVSPRELAAQKWRQAKEASLAGAHAWRDAGAPRSSAAP